MENNNRYTVLSHNGYYVEHLTIDGKLVYGLFKVEYVPQRTYIQSFGDFKEAREEFRKLTGV